MMEEKRFKLALDESRDADGKWLRVTDTLNGVSVRFEEHHFNDSQVVEYEDEERIKRLPNMPMALARIMREIGDWVHDNCYDLAVPYESETFEEAMNGRGYALRKHTYPRFNIKIELLDKHDNPHDINMLCEDLYDFTDAICDYLHDTVDDD